MSLFGSLSTAISGMNAQQDALSNISDDIANSQTVGFKSVGTAFEELVTEQNAQYNGPGGVLASPVYQNNLAGTVVQSATTTNLAISGNGWFTVKASPSTSSTGAPIFSQQDLYTRRGDFQVNSDGYLENGAGFYLEGYQVDPQTGVTNNASLQPIQISQLTSAPVATANVKLSANLPASYPVVGSTGYTAPTPETIQVYDAQGVAHTLTVQFNHTATASSTAVPPTNDTWTADISGSGLGSATQAPLQLTLQFSNGANSAYPAGTLMSMTNTTPGSVTSSSLTVPGTQTTGNTAAAALSFVTNGVTQQLNLNLGSFGSSEGLTEYADSQVTAQTLTQDGIPRGSFQNVSIDQNGYVTLNYDNGQSLKYFQIPVAQFNAAQNLENTNGGAYQTTPTSGAAQLGVPGAAGAGTISPSALESSNVDIASEFTKMIVAQQAYTANSKVITTTDTLLQSVLALIQ